MIPLITALAAAWIVTAFGVAVVLGRMLREADHDTGDGYRAPDYDLVGQVSA